MWSVKRLLQEFPKVHAGDAISVRYKRFLWVQGVVFLGSLGTFNGEGLTVFYCGKTIYITWDMVVNVYVTKWDEIIDNRQP